MSMLIGYLLRKKNYSNGNRVFLDIISKMIYFFHYDAFKQFFILVLFLFGASGFNPFMDNELHKIEWVDQILHVTSHLHRSSHLQTWRK
jgi:hypothetical protein